MNIRIFPFCFVLSVFICFKITNLYAVEADNGNQPVEEDYELATFVVTPSRFSEPMKYTTGSVTLITKRAIEQSNAETVGEVLMDTVGLRVMRQGGIGEEENISIRGAEFDHVIVLIDGIKVNSPYFQEFDFGDLLTDNIERIEVVKGGYSALYGSEALGGVINIITKKGRGKNKFIYQQEGGKDNFFRELLSANGKYGKTGYSISYSRTDSEGYLTRDAFRSNKFSLRLDIDLAKNGTFEYVSRYNDSDKDIDNSFYFDTDPSTPLVHFVNDQNRVWKRRRFSNLLTYKHEFYKRVKSKVYFSLDERRLRNVDPADISVSYTPIATFEDTNEKRKIAGIQLDIKIFGFDDFTSGFEYEEEDAGFNSSLAFGFDDPFSAEKTVKGRINRGYFFRNRFNWKNTFIFNAGFRADNNSTHYTFYSPKFSGAVNIKATSTKLKAGYGKGFKSPSFGDLYNPSVGNPALRPEKSQSYEVGLEQRIFDNHVTVETVFFRNMFRNLIQSIPLNVRQNIGKADTRGLETVLKINPVKSVWINANYTYLETKNIDTGQELTQKPRNALNISVQYVKSDKWDIGVDVNNIGSQFYTTDITDSGGNELKGRNPGYTVVDLYGSIRVPERYNTLKKLTFFGKINNLFDRNYMEVKGSYSQPFTFMLGIRTEI